jgi:large subunit ribosomal protein L18
MDANRERRRKLWRRRKRIRKKIQGSAARPRLSVYRSLRHIYAQLINDDSGVTIAYSSTKLLAEANGGNKDAAKKVGLDIAAKAKDLSIETVIFDRAGRQYHGRVKALAEGAREGGLQF